MFSAVIGIDPGLSGALARISPETGVVDLASMPTQADSSRNILNAEGLAELLYTWRSGPYVHVMLEKAQPMPRDGSMGSFRYGESYGVIIGVLAALKIPYQTTHPATWKAMLFPPGRDRSKEGSRVLAAELFPQVKTALVRKNSHNKAEALLLAEYGWRLLSGTIQAKKRKFC